MGFMRIPGSGMWGTAGLCGSQVHSSACALLRHSASSASYSLPTHSILLACDRLYAAGRCFFLAIAALLSDAHGTEVVNGTIKQAVLTVTVLPQRRMHPHCDLNNVQKRAQRESHERVAERAATQDEATSKYCIYTVRHSGALACAYTSQCCTQLSMTRYAVSSLGTT